MLDDDEMQAVDTWRFATHMPSRASAIRELLKRGLAGEGFAVAGSGAKSKDFGVISNGLGGKNGGTAGKTAK